jgi:hypothetical protein
MFLSKPFKTFCKPQFCKYHTRLRHQYNVLLCFRLVIQCPEFMKNGSEDVVTYSEQLLLFRSVYYMQRNHMERCPGFVELIER